MGAAPQPELRPEVADPIEDRGQAVADDDPPPLVSERQTLLSEGQENGGLGLLHLEVDLA